MDTLTEATSVSETSIDSLPSALKHIKEVTGRLQGTRTIVFLDYDGTLTPIVMRPELAVLSREMRDTLRALTRRCTVAVVSGRDLRDIRDRVGLEGIFYAGSHGFEIVGPKGQHMENEEGKGYLPELDQAEEALKNLLGEVTGARIERKRFSIAVHYREVRDEAVQRVGEAVDRVLAKHEGLRKGYGKRVYELQPRVDWHKGKAVLWLLERLSLDESDVVPLYIGDDTTDEDAFRTLRDRGLSIVVREGSKTGRITAAQYTLKDPNEVQTFLKALAGLPGTEKT